MSRPIPLLSPPFSDSASAHLINRLGYAGLIPFVALTALMWLVAPEFQPFVAIALLGYGAVICSFLGGIHWGIAFEEIQNERCAHPEENYQTHLVKGTGFHLVWGVVPSLVAWVAVVMPAYAGLPVLALLLVVCYTVDRKTWITPALRPWLTLRFRATLVSVLCCLLGAVAT
jgi:hypothetical protein